MAALAAGSWKVAVGDADASKTYAARRSVGRVGAGTVVHPARWNSAAPGKTSCPSMYPPKRGRLGSWPGSPSRHAGSRTGGRYAVTVSTGTSTNVIGEWHFAATVTVT